MTEVFHWLAKLQNLFGTVAVVVAAVIVLSVLNRILTRQGDLTGRRFRNQLIMSGATFTVLVLVILAVPINPTTRGQLLQLIGIIISIGVALSSSTILSNAMAGIMLKAVRNFRSGDFVEVGEHLGRVTERGLFHTEIQTPDRDLVTLPNMYIATNPVTVTRSSGTIISATVSLGYDVPQAKIKSLLQDAAGAIGLQEPFVQVLELGDFSVTYRAAGLLAETKQLLTYRSRLRSSMIDALHEGGVEIVSPHFRNLRSFDPEKAFVPAKSHRKEPEAVDAAPVDVVFDKAEEAESLSSLRHQREQLEEKMKALREELKNAEESGKESLETQIAALQAQCDKLDQAITQAEQAEPGDST